MNCVVAVVGRGEWGGGVGGGWRGLCLLVSRFIIGLRL